MTEKKKRGLDCGSMDWAASVLLEEMIEGKWDGSSSRRLMENLLARLPTKPEPDRWPRTPQEAKWAREDKEWLTKFYLGEATQNRSFKQLGYHTVYYFFQQKSKGRSHRVKLPNGKTLVWRAVVNIKTGVSLTSRRIGPDGEQVAGYAKEGAWFSFKGVRATETEKLRAMYDRRRSDSSEMNKFIDCADRVLRRYGPGTTVGAVLNEIVDEMAS